MSSGFIFHFSASFRALRQLRINRTHILSLGLLYAQRCLAQNRLYDKIIRLYFLAQHHTRAVLLILLRICRPVGYKQLLKIGIGILELLVLLCLTAIFLMLVAKISFTGRYYRRLIFLNHDGTARFWMEFANKA